MATRRRDSMIPKARLDGRSHSQSLEAPSAGFVSESGARGLRRRGNSVADTPGQRAVLTPYWLKLNISIKSPIAGELTGTYSSAPVSGLGRASRPVAVIGGRPQLA